MVININDLKKIRKIYLNKKIVLCFGSFDLFHYEHLCFLNDSKKLGNILVVGLKNDEFIRLKGKERPVIEEYQRAEIVDSIKSVDYTVVADKKTDITSIVEKYQIKPSEYEIMWWSYFYQILEVLQPDILHFEEGNIVEMSRNIYLKEKNIIGVPRKRRAIISTTKIIDKIKKNV